MKSAGNRSAFRLTVALLFRDGATMTNDKLHAAMAGFVARGDIPGIVTLVARGYDVLVDAVGTTTTGGPGNQPMRRDTIFRIASLTKPIAAVATMLLVDDGVLRLDDAVTRWLPELANRRVLSASTPSSTTRSPRGARSRCAIC